MRLWPFGKRAPPVETRQAGGAGFTDAVTRALLSEASGGTIRTPAATAALEAAAGAYSRAFAVASVTPATPTTAALTPELLALAARDLIRRGEFVWLIDVAGDGAVRLLPAGSWDVRSESARSDYFYRLDLFGPSGNVTRLVPGAAVVHGRYSIDPARPWFGISPMGWADLTGRLHASVEDALADEAGGTRGALIPIPSGPDADGDDDDTTDPNADLRADIAALRGKTALVESVAPSGWGEGRTAAPMADWRPQRLGAAPPAPLVDLRDSSARAVLAACGVPAGLFEGGDAAGKRESWRLFLHGGVQPVADLVAAELGAKLDTPGLRLTFDRLFASDVQGRGRAYASMTAGGMDKARAAELAGLS